MEISRPQGVSNHQVSYRTASSGSEGGADSIEDRVDRLDMDWQVSKTFRLPFTSKFREADEAEAAQEIKSGNTGVRVTIEGRLTPVRSTEDLEELEVFSGLKPPRNGVMEFLLNDQTQVGNVSKYEAYNLLTDDWSETESGRLYVDLSYQGLPFPIRPNDFKKETIETDLASARGEIEGLNTQQRRLEYLAARVSNSYDLQMKATAALDSDYSQAVEGLSRSSLEPEGLAALVGLVPPGDKFSQQAEMLTGAMSLDQAREVLGHYQRLTQAGAEGSEVSQNLGSLVAKRRRDGLNSLLEVLKETQPDGDAVARLAALNNPDNDLVAAWKELEKKGPELAQKVTDAAVVLRPAEKSWKSAVRVKLLESLAARTQAGEDPEKVASQLDQTYQKSQEKRDFPAIFDAFFGADPKLRTVVADYAAEGVSIQGLVWILENRDSVPEEETLADLRESGTLSLSERYQRYRPDLEAVQAYRSLRRGGVDRSSSLALFRRAAALGKELDSGSLVPFFAEMNRLAEKDKALLSTWFGLVEDGWQWNAASRLAEVLPTDPTPGYVHQRLSQLKDTPALQAGSPCLREHPEALGEAFVAVDALMGQGVTGEALQIELTRASTQAASRCDGAPYRMLSSFASATDRSTALDSLESGWRPSAVRHFLSSTPAGDRAEWLETLGSVTLSNTSDLTEAGLKAFQKGYRKALSGDRAEAYLDSVRKEARNLDYYARGADQVTAVLEALNEFEGLALQAFLDIKNAGARPTTARELVRGSQKVSPARTAELFSAFGSRLREWDDQTLSHLQEAVEGLEGSSELEPTFEAFKDRYRLEPKWAKNVVDFCLEISKKPSHLPSFGRILKAVEVDAPAIYKKLEAVNRPLEETLDLGLKTGVLQGDYSVVQRQPEALTEFMQILWKWRDQGLSVDETAGLGGLALRSDYYHRTEPLVDLKAMERLPLTSAENRKALVEWLGQNQQVDSGAEYLNTLVSVAPSRVAENHEDLTALGMVSSRTSKDVYVPLCRTLDGLKRKHPREDVVECLEGVVRGWRNRKDYQEVLNAVADRMPPAGPERNAFGTLLQARVEAQSLNSLTEKFHHLDLASLSTLITNVGRGDGAKVEAFLKVYDGADPSQKELVTEWFGRAHGFETPDSIPEFFHTVQAADADERELMKTLLKDRTSIEQVLKIREKIGGREDASAFAKHLRRGGVTGASYDDVGYDNPGLAEAFVNGMLEYREQGSFVWTSRRKVKSDYDRLKGERRKLAGHDFSLYYQLQGPERKDYERLLTDEKLSQAATAWEICRECLPQSSVDEKVRCIKQIQEAGGKALKDRKTLESVFIAIDKLSRSIELSEAVNGMSGVVATAKELPPETVTAIAEQLITSTEPRRLLGELLVVTEPERLIRVARTTPDGPEDLDVEIEEDIIIVGDHALDIG